MKKSILRNLLVASVFVAGLTLTSCRDNNSNNEGTEDAQEANGDTYGSEGALDNEGSGSAAGSGTMDGGTATDTVTGTTTGTTNNNGTGTNSGGTGTGTGTNGGQ